MTAPAATLITKARAELTAGRAKEAVSLADAAIAADRMNPDALAVKVEALLALGQRTPALDAYDAWAAAAKREAMPALGRIARAELEALSTGQVSSIETDALAALADAGVSSARPRLQKLATQTPATGASWPATVVLARLGDAPSAARVLKTARESSGSGRVEALRAVADAKVSGAEPLLRETLAIRDAMVQSAAADAAVALRAKALVPDLQKTAREGEMFAKFIAAAALADLGATGGDALIDAGIKSPAADMRLRAARALRARGVKTWADSVRPLLDDPDGLTRFDAAELLLTVDRQAALRVLTPAMSDPNFAVRAHVARILVDDEATQPPDLRRWLRDSAPHVRLLAARSLLTRTDVMAPKR